LLAFTQLPIEPERFGKLALAIAQTLTGYYPDLTGQTLPSDATEWVALAKRRFGERQAQQTDEPSSITLAEMSADQALKPYLVWAAEQIIPHLDQGLWKQGYCPVCGGPPDLAFLREETGARRLVCSRCNSQWRYRRVGCPFCDNVDHNQIVYYPSEDKVYRLYVCHACQRYLKTVDLRQTADRPVVANVERITTVAMDVAAQQQGYR
jgi:FdhE protein